MEELFGPFNGEQYQSFLANDLEFQKKRCSKKALLVAVEGPSNTGKTTLSRGLEEKTRDYGIKLVHVEGDLFQRSRDESMAVYKELFEKITRKETIFDEFPSRVWDFGKMVTEILSSVKQFNDSNIEERELVLRNVLKDKKPGTEHDEIYRLDKNTVVFVTGMYLSHLSGFDYVLQLNANPEVQLRRKMERSAKLGVSRDLETTRKMIYDIENPATERHFRLNPVKRGMIADVNDFDRICGIRRY